MAIVAAGIVFLLTGGSKPLPQGEAAGVDIPPAKIPTVTTPINPYKERLKPATAKPDQAPKTTDQSWGP